MASTAAFESAQALFCAIADNVGKMNIDNVLNLKKWPTYGDFKSLKKHQKLITLADRRTKTIGVSLSIMEKLLEDKGWYESTVLIAKEIIKKIHTIDSDFSPIQEGGWQDLFYVRGASGGTTTMDYIEKLFSAANKTEKQFGDVNKWSPADIYFASKTAKEKVKGEVDTLARNKKQTYSFYKLNTLCNKLISEGHLFPLSLKKIITGKAKLVKYNFSRSQEEKDLAKLVYLFTKKSGTGRDLQIFFKDKKSQLKFRHDPYHSKFGVSKGIKVEILVQGMGGRLGSASGIPQIVRIIENSGLPSGIPLISKIEKISKTGFENYTTAIGKLNKKYQVKESDTHSKITSRKQGQKLYQQYQDTRAQLSKELLMDTILPILEKWFNTNGTGKKLTDTFDDSSDLLREFIKYASSRSPKSGRFVIAKD